MITKTRGFSRNAGYRERERRKHVAMLEHDNDDDDDFAGDDNDQ